MGFNILQNVLCLCSAERKKETSDEAVKDGLNFIVIVHTKNNDYKENFINVHTSAR